MLSSRVIVGCVIAAAALLLSSPVVLADHLDRFETKRIVRQVEEQNDTLQDRIDDWVIERRDERIHRTEELYRRMDRLASGLEELKGQLRSHDDPWEVRDQVRSVIGSAAEVGHLIEHDFPHEFRHDWEGLRDQINTLAGRFRLEGI